MARRRRAETLPHGSPKADGWGGRLEGQWTEARPGKRAARGARYQAEARRILEADGYLVHEARPVRRRRGSQFWTDSCDLWKAIDLAGVAARGFRFVQVGTLDNAHHKRRVIESIPWPIDGTPSAVATRPARIVRTDGEAIENGYSVELWSRVRGGFQVEVYLPQLGPKTWGRPVLRPLAGPRSRKRGGAP